MRWFFPEFIFRELTLTKTTIRHGLHPKFEYVGSAARRSSSQLWILWTLCGRKQGWWKVKDPPVFLYKMYKNKTESCAMPPILMCFFGCFPQVFVAYWRKNLIFTLLALYPSFCLFWAICGILIQLLSWSSPRHTRRTPKYIVDMYICISYVYIYIHIDIDGMNQSWIPCLWLYMIVSWIPWLHVTASTHSRHSQLCTRQKCQLLGCWCWIRRRARRNWVVLTIQARHNDMRHESSKRWEGETDFYDFDEGE